MSLVWVVVEARRVFVFLEQLFWTEHCLVCEEKGIGQEQHCHKKLAWGNEGRGSTVNCLDAAAGRGTGGRGNTVDTVRHGETVDGKWLRVNSGANTEQITKYCFSTLA